MIQKKLRNVLRLFSQIDYLDFFFKSNDRWPKKSRKISLELHLGVDWDAEGF